MRGITRALAVGLAVAFLAGACGGGGAGGTAGTSSPQTSAVAKPKFEIQTFMYSIQVKGKLRVGTQEDNPPFSVKNPTNSKWEGFDTDIGREIAKAIFGTQGDPDSFIEWVPVTSATRIPSLTDNKADVIIKTFTINEDRKKQIDFSDVYFSTGQRILVKKTNDQIKEGADLGGNTFCAQRGSTSEQNVTKAQPSAKALLLDSYPACLLALQQGQADAVSTDETILFGLVKQDPNTKIVGKYFSTELYGIGVKKSVRGDRTRVVDFLNPTQVAMIPTGTLAQRYEQDISPVSFG